MGWGDRRKIWEANLLSLPSSGSSIDSCLLWFSIKVALFAFKDLGLVTPNRDLMCTSLAYFLGLPSNCCFDPCPVCSFCSTPPTSLQMEPINTLFTVKLLGLIIWSLRRHLRGLAERCTARPHSFSEALIASHTFLSFCLCGATTAVYFPSLLLIII